MKTVFEFFGKPQTWCNIHPYDNSGTKKPQWDGARVEMTIADTRSPLIANPDTLYIEGDLEAVRSILTDGLAMLEDLEALHRRRREATAKACRQCEVCQMWFHPKHKHGHGDGRGMSCFGDGTVSIGGTFVVVVDEEVEPEVIHTTDLRKGDTFRFAEKSHFFKDYNHRQFEVLEVLPADEWGFDSVRIARP